MCVRLEERERRKKGGKKEGRKKRKEGRKRWENEEDDDQRGIGNCCLKTLQFQSVKITGWANFWELKKADPRILRLLNCEVFCREGLENNGMGKR